MRADCVRPPPHCVRSCAGTLNLHKVHAATYVSMQEGTYGKKMFMPVKGKMDDPQAYEDVSHLPRTEPPATD